jgi:hypothetical protein
LDAILEFVQVALECGGEEGNDIQQLSGVERVEVPGLGRSELHEADQLVLDVERVEEQATVTVFP